MIIIVYPDDLKLLFLPVWYSMPGFAIYLLILYGVTNHVTITLSFGMGMIVMLLVYEWKHYIAHRPIRPLTHFGRWLKKHIFCIIIKMGIIGSVCRTQCMIFYLVRIKMEKMLN